MGSYTVMAQSDKVKLLDRCRVAPPPGSVPPTTLPLTYFDLLFFRNNPVQVQRLFLYQLPCSTSTFLDAHLPDLKRSLSLALKHFYPLAGRIILPGRDGGEPVIRYSDGDSVELTVAECVDDFHDLTANHRKDATRFHPLVPVLSLSQTEQALVAVHVTLFPDQGGLGIGVAALHAGSDGTSSIHFMKTWGAIHRLGGDESLSSVLNLPDLDRSVIPDPHGLKKTFLAQWEEMRNRGSVASWGVSRSANLVRATFVLTRSQLDGLRQRVLARTSIHVSPFSAACGAAWVSFVKAREGLAIREREWFSFTSNCRGRRDSVPVGPTYFGNCIAFCSVEATREELVGGDGLAAASTAIHGTVQGLKGGGALRGAEKWIERFAHTASVRGFGVAGSPILGVYGVDFGWGRARKVEGISVERIGGMCLAENRDEEEGGVEVGIALPGGAMDAFSAAMDEILTTCS